MGMRTRMAFLLGLLLWMGSAPGWAAVDNIRLGGYKFYGSVQSVGPAGIIVNTADGPVLVPSDMRTNLRLHGDRIERGQLVVGTPIEVSYYDLRGSVVGTQGNLVLFRVSNRSGPPLQLPQEYVHHTKVYVHLKNGALERVPLDQALMLQNAQGAVILGSDAPEAYYPYRGYAYPRYGSWWGGWYGPRWHRHRHRW